MCSKTLLIIKTARPRYADAGLVEHRCPHGLRAICYNANSPGVKYYAPRKLSPITAAGPREIAGTPITEAPEPPAWMNDIAADKFRQVAGYLTSLGAVTIAEIALVEQYCCCYSRWVSAETILANGDPGWRTVLTRQGTEGTSVPSPAMLQMRQALDQMRKLGAALGLARVERARLPTSRNGEPQDEMDMLLRERRGAVH